jgi:hypothetical protein
MRRLLLPTVLALVVWTLVGPFASIACEPAAPCASGMKNCPHARRPAPGTERIEAPSCCLPTRSAASRAVLTGSKLPSLAVASVTLSVASDLFRSIPPLAAPGAVASRVPLYRLHSVLLI